MEISPRWKGIFPKYLFSSVVRGLWSFRAIRAFERRKKWIGEGHHNKTQGASSLPPPTVPDDGRRGRGKNWIKRAMRDIEEGGTGGRRPKPTTKVLLSVTQIEGMDSTRVSLLEVVAF